MMSNNGYLQFENLPQQDNKKMGGHMEAGLTQILLVRIAFTLRIT